MKRKEPKDYHVLAKKRGFEWLGPEVLNSSTKTFWKCLVGHEWEACHVDIRRGSGCPTCVDIVNGAKVSGVQRQIHKMMGGVLNHPCGPYKIDVALLGKKIAIEYDCWFWHGHKHEYDAKRDAFLLARGWKILHIKTRDDMPSKWKLEEAIAKLENGEERIEIVLDDWGKGLTFAEVRARKKVDPWEKGPIPISLDGVTFTKCQQLGLWRNDMPATCQCEP